MRLWLFLLFSTALATFVSASPIRVITIGDSLTEEYAFEYPFSAPEAKPLSPNTANWVEILSDHRGEQFSAGTYKGRLASYSDLRNAGYSYNYGIPAYDTQAWIRVIRASITDREFSTRLSLTQQLQTRADVVVIMLGGNDLKNDYAGIYRNETPPALLDRLVKNLLEIHDFVRAINTTAPIIIATAPDIGATPVVADHYNDPVLAARARQRIANTNDAIIAAAQQRRATVMRVDELTEQIYNTVPFHLNGTIFSLEAHRQNPPNHLFCRDGFHPSTSGQALLARLAIEAINQAMGSEVITPLENREILEKILKFNPDQPYLDWAASHQVGDPFEDPDGDGLPNLVEFVLASDPSHPSRPLQLSADGTLSFASSEEAQRYASLTPEESTNLINWHPVPEARINRLENAWQVLPAGPSKFYRLAISPRP